MGWFSDLFTTKSVVTDSGLPKVSNIPPMPKVKPCKPEKNISEPVYAIVKAMKERPSNFKVINTESYGGRSYGSKSYTVKDIRTGKSLTATLKVIFYGDFRGGYTYNWSWLTDDEGALLLKEFCELNKRKLKRKLSIERAAMKAIYK